MDLQAFHRSLSESTPPSGLTLPLQALWYDAKGDGEKAHALVQSQQDAHSCWVHAFLHREEGDFWNANHWYGCAGKTMPNCALQEEWQTIVADLIG